MEQHNDALAVAERFEAALNKGDADGVRAAYSPDAKIWHNFDDKYQTVEENIKTMHWLHTRLNDVKYDIQSRIAIPGGFLQQHILRGMLTSGKPFALHACAICKVENGRISELKEYLDTAQARPLYE